MTLSTRIAPHLPYLRRFSRATTGSQTSGDAYVAATLEALIADVSLFPEASNDRIALYKLFSALFSSSAVQVPEPTSTFAWEKRAAHNLANLSPRPRQAFLLVAVEGFTHSQAAEILSVSEPEFASLLDEASVEISRQVATEIMIIEDEPLIAMDLEALVEGLGHNVIGVARTRTEAIKIASEGTRPGLILADIQLADGSSGLDAVNDLLKTFEVPVIFITAYPERFLTGERPEPAFLIAKPFQPANVSAVISQALFFQQSARRREIKSA